MRNAGQGCKAAPVKARKVVGIAGNDLQKVVSCPSHEVALQHVGNAGDGLFKWVAENVQGAGGRRVQFVSTSGGTDLNGSFFGGVPWLPIYEGELQVRTCLGTVRVY